MMCDGSNGAHLNIQPIDLDDLFKITFVSIEKNIRKLVFLSFKDPQSVFDAYGEKIAEFSNNFRINTFYQRYVSHELLSLPYRD